MNNDIPTVLQITIHRGSQLYNPNFISKSDPYVIVRVGDTEQQTRPDKNGGKTPRWEQSLSFTYGDEEFMSMRVYDKDLFLNVTTCYAGVTRTADDFIGSSEFPLRHIAQSESREYTGSVPLTRGEGKNAGYIDVSIRFFGSLVQSHTRF